MSNLLFTDMYYVMAQCGGLWGDLMGKRIFLTGCSGFIGTWMLESFSFANKGLELKAELVGLCRRPFYSQTPGITIVQGDVRNFDFPDGKFDYIIHVAGGRGNDTLQTSVQGTERVIEFAKHCGAKRIVFTSSGAIYTADTLFAEHAYGEGKRAAEMLLTLSKLDTRIARIFSLVGPDMDFERYAIGQFIKQGCEGKPIKLKGGKNVTRSFLYAADMTCSLWMMTLYDQAAMVYNVGSGEAITIADLADKVAEVCGVSVEHEDGEYPESVYVPPGLNYAPNIKLHDAIDRTVAWYKNQHKEQKGESR